MSLTAEVRPNGYIGVSVPRPNAPRLLQGRGRFVDDKALPRMVHAAFLRSPHAQARIAGIDTAAARAVPGVVAVWTGAEMAAHITPWVGVLTHLSGMRSPPQPATAVDVARWQGEPVAMVVARSRAEAVDALAAIEVDYDPLPAVTDMDAALKPEAPRIHPDLDSNLCWERRVDVGAIEAAFTDPGATVVERPFTFGRHTGVTLEPRAVIGDYDPAEDRLTVHYSGQGPHMMQAVVARHLGLPEARVRVRVLDFWVVEDVGTMLNPKLVEEQIRGGVVQGIGGALYEECVYDAEGQLQNATRADYLVPMAGEMPDITIDHVVTPSRTSDLGAKGAGEAGTAGAPGAVMNAINDALRPLGAAPLSQMPMTPERILRALGRIGG